MHVVKAGVNSSVEDGRDMLAEDIEYFDGCPARVWRPECKYRCWIKWVWVVLIQLKRRWQGR